MAIRENRKTPRLRTHDVTKTGLGFRYNDQELSGEICDFSRFGLCVRITEGETLPKKNDIIEDIVIRAYGETRNLGPGRIARISRVNEEKIFGLFLEREFIDLDFLADRQSIFLQEDELKSIRYFFQYRNRITDEISKFAAHFAFGLGVYKRSLDQLDEKFAGETKALREVLFQATLRGIGGSFRQYLDDSLSELAKITEGYTRRQHEENGFYLRRVVWPFILESVFLRRTNLKPRGYAGDSIMMEMCYRNEYLGNSSFGRIFHRHPLETEAAQAVRARRSLINMELNQAINESGASRYKIMSVACGPAWEIRDFLESGENRFRMDLVLLDQDEEALEEARSGIEAIPVEKPIRVTYLRDSVRRLLKTANPSRVYGEFDLIYSLGLFDYLTAPVAKAVLMKLYSLAAPGGHLIIGNYHVGNPTRIYMDYLMDWSLIYRDEESFRGLASDLTGMADLKIGFEETGSQMFLHVRKEE